MKEVLIVCTGNLCRSPMAQGYLHDQFARRGLLSDWKTSSAGTHARVDAPATEEACFLCQEKDFDIQQHRAQLLTHDHVSRAETILVMERVHRDLVLMLSPHGKDKIHLLTDFLSGKGRGRDIPDPFMKPYRFYVETFEVIQKSLDAFLEHIVPAVS